jgi:hypothetical protein
LNFSFFTVLDRGMTTKVPRTAMILAAGLGARMGQLTTEMPKTLLTVQRRPILAHILWANRCGNIWPTKPVLKLPIPTNVMG